MKRNVILCMAMLAVAACVNVGDGFSEEEMELIRSGGGDVMRVMKSDVPEESAVLRLTAKEVSDMMVKTEDFGLLCRRMLATVQAPENDGVGIAAPQVGISRRLIAVQRFDRVGEPFCLYVNPEIVRYGEEVVPSAEGCLSVPSVRGTVERAREIDLRYRTIDGVDTLETVSGFTAVIFQHEIDHLDGILYTDRASAADLD